MVKKLSIIVAVFNIEDYIENCLESFVCIPADLKSQIEVIVINDGSTDSTPQLLKQYTGHYDDFIFVYSKKNGGLSSARNFGIEKSNGEFIWFVDGDDYIETKNIRKLIDILIKTNAEYLIFQANRVDEKKQVIGRFSLNSGYHINEERMIFSFELIQNGMSKHMSWMRVYKKSIIEVTKYPEGITHEDIHFDLNILMKAPIISYYDLIIYNHYFDNPDSITNTMNLKKYLDVLWVYQNLSSESHHRSKYIAKEIIKISAFGVLRRLMYILTLNNSRSDKLTIFEKYSEMITQNDIAYAYLRSHDHLNVWDNFFIKLVKMKLLALAILLVKLKSLL